MPLCCLTSLSCNIVVWRGLWQTLHGRHGACAAHQHMQEDVWRLRDARSSYLRLTSWLAQAASILCVSACALYVHVHYMQCCTGTRYDWICMC